MVEKRRGLRVLCALDVAESTACLGGLDANGQPLEVEIDESCFTKRKFNRGRLRNMKWVFGAYERLSGRCFLVPILNRTAETLINIIRSRILPGSRIISDGWAAYRGIQILGIYTHDVIVHAMNFVSLHDPTIHTQIIESTWAHAKKKLKN